MLPASGTNGKPRPGYDYSKPGVIQVPMFPLIHTSSAPKASPAPVRATTSGVAAKALIPESRPAAPPAPVTSHHTALAMQTGPQSPLPTVQPAPIPTPQAAAESPVPAPIASSTSKRSVRRRKPTTATPIDSKVLSVPLPQPPIPSPAGPQPSSSSHPDPKEIESQSPPEEKADETPASEEPPQDSPRIVLDHGNPRTSYRELTHCCSCNLLAALIVLVAGAILTAYSQTDR